MSAAPKGRCACKTRIAEALAGHPLHAVLDWRRERPEIADPKSFFDQTHYRHPLAEKLLADVAAALGRLRAGSPR